MFNNGPNYLSDEDGGGGPVPPSSQCFRIAGTHHHHHHHQWPRLMKPPPFLISMAAVINYVCPTPNTNIVIFGGGWGSWFISLWWSKEGDEWPLIMVICRDREEGSAERRTWTGPAQESRVYRETPVWVLASLSRALSPAVRELN